MYFRLPYQVIAVLWVTVIFYSCRKDKIAIPADFECRYGNLVFSSDTSVSINAFYPVKTGNYWNYSVKKYVYDTLDTSYTSSFFWQVTGTKQNYLDTLWQMNNNSSLIFGKQTNSIFTPVNSGGACLLPVTYLLIPQGNDTLTSIFPGNQEFRYYNSTDTVVTPAGIFYNPVIKQGLVYGYYYTYYFVNGIGLVKSTSQANGSATVMVTLLDSYVFN